MMKPKFKNILEYEKSQLLLQPIYIRLVDNIRQKSELLEWDVSYEEVIKPFPSYIVSLKKGTYCIKNNIWELCFKICFINYQSNEIELVETDKNLINENGEIDWQQIEFKTKNIVNHLFNHSIESELN